MYRPICLKWAIQALYTLPENPRVSGLESASLSETVSRHFHPRNCVEMVQFLGTQDKSLNKSWNVLEATWPLRVLCVQGIGGSTTPWPVDQFVVLQRGRPNWHLWATVHNDPHTGTWGLAQKALPTHTSAWRGCSVHMYILESSVGHNCNLNVTYPWKLNPPEQTCLSPDCSCILYGNCMDSPVDLPGTDSAGLIRFWQAIYLSQRCTGFRVGRSDCNSSNCVIAVIAMQPRTGLLLHIS